MTGRCSSAAQTSAYPNSSTPGRRRHRELTTQRLHGYRIIAQPSTCGPTTTPSAAKRSTLARCVAFPRAQRCVDRPRPFHRAQGRRVAAPPTLRSHRDTFADICEYRASSMSVATARSSASRTASPRVCSSSARTPAALPGPPSTGDSTRRVSLRLVDTGFAPQLARDMRARRHRSFERLRRTYRQGLMRDRITTGGCQEALPPHRQAPARHRRCFPRCDQGAPLPAPRGPRRRPPAGHQGRQGQEGRL